MRKNLLFSFLSILIGFGQLMAQDRTLTGVVKDENGQTLPGVNVLLKGSNRGTSSDGEGTFKLSVSNAGTLVFSSVGYTTTEVAFTASQSTVQAAMNTDTRTLSEVVVTALGISKDSKVLSYATQQINSKTFSQARELNVANSLAGRVAGLDIARSSSGLGGSTRVVLRGAVPQKMQRVMYVNDK